MAVSLLESVTVMEINGEELLARSTAVAQATWPGGQVVGLHPLPGGVSSLTFASTLVVPHRPDQRLVLKVAPPHLAPVRNRDVLRQARILRLLGAVPDVPSPRVLLEDGGTPPFFAMEFLPGQCFEPRLDVMADPPPPEIVDVRARTAARTLARIHFLSLDEIGVANEPVMSLKDELDRWADLFQTVDPDICHGHHGLYSRLADSLPAPANPTLVHGDFRLANMVFCDDLLQGIIDWEIWSVGDPRIDLSWLLMHTDPVHRFTVSRNVVGPTTSSGMPTLTDLLAEYLKAGPGSQDSGSLEWFLAYSHYKTASAVAVIVKRNRHRSHPEPFLDVAGGSLGDVIARGHEIVACHERGTVWRS